MGSVTSSRSPSYHPPAMLHGSPLTKWPLARQHTELQRRWMKSRRGPARTTELGRGQEANVMSKPFKAEGCGLLCNPETG
jgi:hypothetical protein